MTTILFFIVLIAVLVFWVPDILKLLSKVPIKDCKKCKEALCRECGKKGDRFTD